MSNQKGVIPLAIPIVIAAALIGVVAFGYFYWLPKEKENNNASQPSAETNTNQLLGGDEDEHGCKGSAGYSWCELKQKCLRVWEEECSEATNTNASSNVNLNTNTSNVNTACSNGWLTYTNQKYGYTVKYPNTMTVTELTQDEFSLSEEEGQSGLTFAQKFATYGEELCVTFKINNTAYVTIAAPAAVLAQMACGRTGVGAIIDDIERTDPLTIDGTNYTGTGHIYISEDPGTGVAGTKLDYKNETNHVILSDKTSFEYGSTGAANVLYTAYEPLRETLICLMESYKKL